MTADPRTPGQVAREEWWAQSQDRLTMNPEGWDAVAAAVLAHDAANRKSRGDVVVDRGDVEVLTMYGPGDDGYDGPVTFSEARDAANRLRAALDAQESP